jgi:hypothetical protein
VYFCASFHVTRFAHLQPQLILPLIDSLAFAFSVPLRQLFNKFTTSWFAVSTEAMKVAAFVLQTYALLVILLTTSFVLSLILLIVFSVSDTAPDWFHCIPTLQIFSNPAFIVTRASSASCIQRPTGSSSRTAGTHRSHRLYTSKMLSALLLKYQLRHVSTLTIRCS